MKSKWLKEAGKHIGVLALQGAFAKHLEVLQFLNVSASLIRHPEQLDRCDALIIPGGESTAMWKHIERMQFEKPLHVFGNKKPVFGTCAGAILMAASVGSQSVKSFGFMDITIQRNGYGRQIESFSTEIEFPSSEKKLISTFIRAPIIQQIGPNVSVLATYKNKPVLVRQGSHLCCTFHPELRNQTSIHEYFISLI